MKRAISSLLCVSDFDGVLRSIHWPSQIENKNAFLNNAAIIPVGSKGEIVTLAQSINMDWKIQSPDRWVLSLKQRAKTEAQSFFVLNSAERRRISNSSKSAAWKEFPPTLTCGSNFLRFGLGALVDPQILRSPVPTQNANLVHRRKRW